MRYITALFLITCILFGNTGGEARSLRAQLDSAQSDCALYRERTQDLQAEVNELLLRNRSIYGWEPMEISLPEDLQKYTAALAHAYDVPPSLVFAIGQRESQWTWQDAAVDSNYLPSVGYMQINEPHWERLSAMDIDVHTPHGNIQGGIVILSELLEKYPLEQAVAAYNAGESGMTQGQGAGYAQEVLAAMDSGSDFL